MVYYMKKKNVTLRDCVFVCTSSLSVSRGFITRLFTSFITSYRSLPCASLSDITATTQTMCINVFGSATRSPRVVFSSIWVRSVRLFSLLTRSSIWSCKCDMTPPDSINLLRSTETADTSSPQSIPYLLRLYYSFHIPRGSSSIFFLFLNLPLFFFLFLHYFYISLHTYLMVYRYSCVCLYKYEYNYERESYCRILLCICARAPMLIWET